MSLGCIFLYAGIIDSSHPLPTGFLLCNGNTFDQNTYPTLYTFLNSNTLPNLVKRYPVMYTPSPIGTIGGSENISMGAIPSHTHGSGDLSLADHSHNISNSVPNYASSINNPSDFSPNVGDTAVTAYASGLQVNYSNNDNTVSGNFDSSGSNASIPIVNVYITINYIIKAS